MTPTMTTTWNRDSHFVVTSLLNWLCASKLAGFRVNSAMPCVDTSERWPWHFGQRWASAAPHGAPQSAVTRSGSMN